MKALQIFFHSLLIIIVLSSSDVAAQESRKSKTKIEQERAGLIRTDNEFSRMSAEKGVSAAFLTYMGENATLLLNGSEPISGSDKIRAYYAQASPSTHLTWKPTNADIAASGDLGYTFGTYLLTGTDAVGKPVMRYGKYLTIWKKQLDGSWKFVVDMGNSSPPPATTK